MPGDPAKHQLLWRPPCKSRAGEGAGWARGQAEGRRGGKPLVHGRVGCARRREEQRRAPAHARARVYIRVIAKLWRGRCAGVVSLLARQLQDCAQRPS